MAEGFKDRLDRMRKAREAKASDTFADLEKRIDEIKAGANEVTTMANSTWRTMAPKVLKTLSESSLTVAYDPATYAEIIALVNVNTLITITFPDSSTLAFYGWLDEFAPGEIVEGEQPEADITIQPSNRHSSTRAETAPVYAA